VTSEASARLPCHDATRVALCGDRRLYAEAVMGAGGLELLVVGDHGVDPVPLLEL
jgi:hypothetical protein